MARKLSKRKRVHHRSHKSQPSAIATLFTFPKLAIYGFVILLVMLVYEVSVPSHDVKGASTESTFKYKIDMTIFKEKNPVDARRQDDEPCLAKTFRVKIKDKDGNVRQVTATGNSNCKSYAIPVPTVKGYCNIVSFVNDIANWKITGLQYSDSNHNGKVLLGQSSIKICVYPPGEGLNVNPYAVINFGLKQK